jgi:hypothetical protein
MLLHHPSTARRSATQAPEIAAVRVPPSAWMTSQSRVICRSPERLEIDHGAQAAADQALDFLGAPRLLAGRRLAAPAVWVARGSMPYSAVTQPLPLPRSQGGRLVPPTRCTAPACRRS